MNSIDIIFLSAQYSIYGFVVYTAYQKFIKPALMHERQEAVFQDAQLTQLQADSERHREQFKQQVAYHTHLLNKIGQQVEQSQQKAALLERELEAQREALKRRYEQSRERVDKQRELSRIYHLLAPEIIQGVEAELVEFYQKNSQPYLKNAICVLRKECREEHKDQA
jgi:hypothetical protein